MSMSNELFDDIDTAGLDSEDTPEVDKALGRQYDDDHGAELYQPAERIDRTEQITRQTDYESAPGRVRVGGENELDLSRVSIEGGGKDHGNAGGDWEGNMSTGKGMTACDGTGYVADTRGSSAYTGQHEDVDDETHKELKDAGLRLGLNSVDTYAAGFAIANAAYMKSKERWRMASPEYKKFTYAKRKWERRHRDWEQIRADSVQRHYSKTFSGFLKDRTEADPYWTFLSDDEIAHMDGIDSRSARQMAETWRMGQDDKAMQALIVKYISLVDGVKPDSIRARFKKRRDQKDLAEFVTIRDAIACGVLSPMGFDADELLQAHGDELTEMEAAVDEQTRREFLINGAHEFFKAGGLMPPYVWEPIDPLLSSVVEILEGAGIDMVAPEDEIDWSQV